MSKQTGGPAFPNKASGCGGSSLDSNGMTLRDYFAAQAMQALISGYLSSENGTSFGFKLHEGDHEHAANVSYMVADAMIAERNK